MAQVISEGYFSVQTEYRLEFSYKKNTLSGFSFECDPNGVVDVSALGEAALESYRFCEANRDKFARISVDFRETETWHPKVIRCGCGDELRLEYPDAYGSIECGCGALYNLSGQRLRPRSQWEERFDDDY